MSTYDIRVGARKRLLLNQAEFADLTQAIFNFRKAGFRDGFSVMGNVRVIECGELLSSPAASKPQDATAMDAARNIKNDAGESSRKETE